MSILCNKCCSLTGSSVHGITPGKNTEWVAIPPFSEDLPDSEVQIGSPALQSESLGKPLQPYRLLKNAEYSFPCYTAVLSGSLLSGCKSHHWGALLPDLITSPTPHIFIPSCLGGCSISACVTRGHTNIQPFLSGIISFFPLWLAYSWYLPFSISIPFFKLSYRSIFITKDISLLSHVVEIFSLVFNMNFKLIFVVLNF